MSDMELSDQEKLARMVQRGIDEDTARRLLRLDMRDVHRCPTCGQPR